MRPSLATSYLAASLFAAAASLITVSASDAQSDGTVHLSPAVWSVPINSGTLRAEGATAVVEAAVAGPLLVQSQYWQTPVQPGAKYTLSVHVTDSEAFRVTHVRLAWRCNGGAEFIKEEAAAPAGSSRTYQATATAPPQCDYARVEIAADALNPPASFSFSAASLTMVAPPPIIEPPPTPSPTASPSATAVVTATSSATASPTATASASATPTATATASATPTATPTPGISAGLWNANFAHGDAGWAVTAGTTSAEGLTLYLTSSGTSTAYVQQAVTVAPSSWYVASATLTPLSGVTAGWVRIAWYASADASGSQLSTNDSPVITSGRQLVTAGPVQAPVNAQSARVRILLRPATSGARLAIEQVTFVASGPPPPTPTATPTETATAGSGVPNPTTPAYVDPDPAAPSVSPQPPATPGGTATPGASRPPRSTRGTPSVPAGGGQPAVAHVPGSAPPPDIDALSAAQRWLRITEVLPNPSQPGADTAYEWVEITNIGAAPVSTSLMQLGDNSRSLLLDTIELQPGASFVIAGMLAEVDGAALVQRVEKIGSGLSNAGDRVVLLAADGSIVDALSYGSDLSVTDGEPIAAPGEGQSIERRFDVEGNLLEIAYLDRPNPGSAAILTSAGSVVTPPVGGTASRSGTEPAALAAGLPPPAGRTEQTTAWMMLTVIAGGALGGAALARVVAIVRNRGDER